MRSDFILASGSRYKEALLGRLGIPFLAVAADTEEVRHVGEKPDLFAARMAFEKASALQAKFPDAWILGVDQVIALREEIFSKPGTREKACEQLGQLQGQEHQLLTAMCMLSPSGEASELVRFEMKMRPLSAAAIERYVALDQPIDCAGAYKIEEAGIRLFESCKGDDFTAIVGLACTRVIPLLKKTGYQGLDYDA